MNLTTTSECLVAVCFDLSLWKHQDDKTNKNKDEKYEQLPCRSEFVWTVYKFNSTGFLFKTRIIRHQRILLSITCRVAAVWRQVTQRILIFVKLQQSFSDCSKMHPKWLSRSGLKISGSCILAMRDTVTVWKHKPSPDWGLRVIYDARRVTKRHLQCHISQCISHPLPFNFVLNRPDRGCFTLLNGWFIHSEMCVCVKGCFSYLCSWFAWRGIMFVQHCNTSIYFVSCFVVLMTIFRSTLFLPIDLAMIQSDTSA